MIVLPLLAVSLAVSMFTASVPVPATPAVIVAKAGAVLAINAGATAVAQAVTALPGEDAVTVQDNAGAATAQ